MEEYVGSLVGRYREAGVLVDTNLLLLYLVGAYDVRRIRMFSRTEQFEPDDFPLHGYLSSRGVDVLNFNNIRPFEY